ncbi:MAG TPA: hypothetical protein VEA58_08300, partial [Anaerovoracaceae bacterium]|nr:hypothetical protein [Anaerovoracaceae bacterium]
SASIISVIYSSMSAIATSAGGDGIGAVTDITFGGISVIPTTFSALQGSYILSGNPTFTVYAVSDDVTIAVSTGTSLGTLLALEGTVTPQSSAGGIYVYDLSDLPAGTWILIDASDLGNPALNRKYIIYKF